MADHPTNGTALGEGEEVMSDDSPAVFSRWFLIVFPPVIAAVYAWQVYALPSLRQEPIISPRAWPTGVAITLCTTAAAVALGAVLRKWRTASGPTESGIGSWRDISFTVMSLAIFILVIAPLGYVLSAFLLITGLTMLVSPQRWVRNMTTAAVFAILSSILFSGLLDVRLPQGILPLPWS